ncbi:MAG: hypothetical protein HKO66_04645 [Saprospiraceae bacterium]|nr:hypothetical protein [Bacteroidia bacterium]NNL91499.1 hypothetical protein [Saprospiraceae bacterium]
MPSLKIIPSFGAFYNFSSVETDDISEPENNVSSRLSMTFLLSKFYRQPKYLISKKNIFSIELGYYFS